MGYIMGYSLANPLQSDDNGIHIDICPNNYYTDDSSAHTVTLQYGTIIPIPYDGVLIYIPFQRPTPE